jgi:hypothetical protein
MADPLESELQEIIEALSGNPSGSPPPGTEDKLKWYLDLIIFLIENGGGTTLAAEKAELAAALAGLRYQVGDVFTTTREGAPLALLGYGEWLQLEGVLYGTITELAGGETGDGKIARSNLPNVTLSFSATTESAGDHTHTQNLPSAYDRTWMASGWSGSDPRGNGKADTESAGSHTHSVSGSTSSLNSGATQTEFKPRGIYVYHWLRTA